jgi:hypothetical protein
MVGFMASFIFLGTKMITAHQARILVQTSSQVMTKRLEDISKKIEEAAKLGKTSIILDHALPHDNFYKVEKRDYQPVELTEAQRLLKKELEFPNIGFGVKIVEQRHSGQAGLGATDDNPKPFSTWHIQVSW